MQISRVFSINRVFLYQLRHPPSCLGNFVDYGRQFHEDDRDTQSQSQNEEGLFRFKHNLPHWSISKGLITWCLSVPMQLTYSFFCWLSFTGQVSVKFQFVVPRCMDQPACPRLPICDGEKKRGQIWLLGLIKDSTKSSFLWHKKYI